MESSSEPRPPKFQQGPRDFCVPPEETIEIFSPGPESPRPRLNLESMLIPLMVMAAGATIAVRFFGSGNYVFIGILMAVGGAVASVISFMRQRTDYTRSIEERKKQFEENRAKAEAQAILLRKHTQDCLLKNDPGIESCLKLAQSREPTRLWARIANDPDFLHARLGLGTLPFQVKFKLPSPMNPLVKDPLEVEADELEERFRTISNVPVMLDLTSAGVTGIAGERDAGLATTRAIAVQLATNHSPELLRLAAIFPEKEEEQWKWIRWLPHVWRSDRQLRYVAASQKDAQTILDDLASVMRQRENQLETRHRSGTPPSWPAYYVVFIAAPSMLNPETRRLLTERGPQLGFHAIFLAGREAELPRECGAIISVGPNPTLQRRKNHSDLLDYRSDPVNVETADEFSRLLAPLRFESAAGAIPNLVGLLELLELDRVEDWDVLGNWQRNDSTKSLAVPIGIGAGGRPVMFDIHDAGHGPHGLAAGTSGSGKTRFLECLVAIQAAHFHPHELSFMLVDFKGSDFLRDLPDLPHCISVLSSIEGKSEEEQTWQTMRALKALQAESKRRQRMFNEYDVGNIIEYHERQREDLEMPRVPRLVIIVDEFAELAAQQPDFLAGLVSLARIGRSLGMHLILATQQPAGIVTDQIWANSRFRFSMKFNKTEDSQAVLKRPDAAYIEQRGRGYLQVGENEVFDLFQGPYGGLPYEEIDPGRVDPRRDLEVVQVALNGERTVHLKRDETKVTQTQLRALVQHIKSEAKRAGVKPIPNLLPENTDNLVSLTDIRIERGWNGTAWKQADDWLHPIMGILDDPAGQLSSRSQKIPLLQPDLDAFGHLFICCDIADHTKLPLRTLITSLALDHSPAELNFYALDFGNSRLSVFSDLPHMGAIIRINETRRITRLFRWLLTELEQRRELLAPHGIPWAQAKQQGIELGRPTLVLVIDNLVKWKDDLDRKEEIGALINEGAQNGIHLILAGEERASKLFGSVLGGINPRLALGFPDRRAFRDVVESMTHDQNVLGGFPDKGVYYDMDTGVIECRVVAPVRLEASETADVVLRNLTREMRNAARKAKYPRPFKIGELPREMVLADITPEDIQHTWQSWDERTGLCVPIGLDDLTLEPLSVDLQEEGPHFLVVGSPQGGKTTALHTWLLSLAAHVPPHALQLVLFDNIRHTLEPLSNLPHVWQTISTDEETKALFANLRKHLEDRSKPMLHPPIVLVFDDLVQFDDTTLRTELARLVNQGASRGLHVLAAGRTADMQKYGELEKVLLRYRSGLFVGSHSVENDAMFFDMALPIGLGRERLPRGRGYLIRQGEYRLMQVATPGDADQVREWARQIASAAEAADMCDAKSITVETTD